MISFLIYQPCFARETLLIKKYKRPGNTLLDRKIRYLDMGTHPQSQSKTSLNQLAAPTKVKPQSKAKKAEKSYQVKKLAKKNFQVKSIKAKESQENTNGEYKEEDWEGYAEFTDSLNVNAKITNYGK